MLSLMGLKQMIMAQSTRKNKILRVRAGWHLWAGGKMWTGHVRVVRLHDLGASCTRVGGRRWVRHTLVVPLEVMLQSLPTSERLPTDFTSKWFHLEVKRTFWTFYCLRSKNYETTMSYFPYEIARNIFCGLKKLPYFYIVVNIIQYFRVKSRFPQKWLFWCLNLHKNVKTMISLGKNILYNFKLLLNGPFLLFQLSGKSNTDFW